MNTIKKRKQNWQFHAHKHQLHIITSELFPYTTSTANTLATTAFLFFFHLIRKKENHCRQTAQVYFTSQMLSQQTLQSMEANHATSTTDWLNITMVARRLGNKPFWR